MKWNVGKGLGVIGLRCPNHSPGGIALWRRAVGFTALLWRGDERPPDAGSRSVARREKGARLASGACSRRGCFCSFALAVLAVLATLAPEPAAAQTVTTFISNTGQTGGGVTNQTRATAFTTGTGTYTLSSVAIAVSTPTVGSNPTPLVRIYTNGTDSLPGTLLATMTNPATIVDDTVNIFTAPANTTLAASTTYWLVTSNSAETNGLGFRVNVVANTNLDSGTAAGWSIGNARFKNDISAASWDNSSNRSQFQIRGTEQAANAAPTVANAIPDQTATAATGFSYQIPANTFNDTDTGDTLSYMATKADGMALPTWLRFTAGTRTFAGTPAASDVGTVSMEVTASDGHGGSVSDTFDITVEADNTPPTLIGAEVFSAGASIGLRFSEVMATTRPQASAFTITADGSAVTISQFGSRTGQPDVIGVTLSPVTIRQGQAVVITYTDPTTGDDAAIQDIAGNDAASFTTGMNGVPAVTNNSTLAFTAPGAPASLTATASGSTTINLSWTAPADNGGSAVTGYKIEVSPDGTTNWTELVADTTATTYAHTGLAAGTTRHYRVSAINTNGTGLPSRTADATTGTTVPGAPDSLTATASGSTTIDLSWSAPDTTGGSAITGYKIEVSPDGTSNWTELVANTTSTDTTYAHTGLAAGTTRHYRVSAINSVGTGLPSDAANATTTDTVPNAAPIVANAIPDQSATAGTAFSYQVPANTFNDTDTGDTLSYMATKADGMALPTWLGFIAGTRTFSGTPATADVGTVAVKVTASDGNGGSVSDTFGIVVEADNTPPTLIGAEVFSAGASIGLRFSEVMATTRPQASAFTITADGSAVTISQFGSRTGQPDVIGVTLSPVTIRQGQAVVITYTDPTTGDDAQAIQDIAGNDAASFTTGMNGVPAVTNNSTLAPTVPGAPASLTATASGSTTINLSWTAPDTTGGSAITGYKIEVSPDGTTNWTELVADTAATTYAHTGLAGGTTRHYRVSAINSVGTGLPSSTANATTATTVPGAPDSLSATASGSTQIDLSWTAPADNGGSAVTGYKIEVSSDSASSWTDLVADTATTTYAHTGLAAGTTRHYRVSAINTNGTGLPSRTADATTGTTVPGAPDSLTATASGSTQIDLSWTAPADNGGSAVTGYQIEVSPDGTTNWTDLVADTAATTYAHTGLAAGTTRHYRVSAINSVGTGLPSSTANATTGAPPNNPPTVANEIPDQEAVAGTAFSYQVPANAFSDPDSDTLAYAAIKADDSMLPTWMSFDADTRTFSGMPASTDTGTVSVKVTVSDGNGGSISDEFDILVVPALTVSLEEADSYVAEGNSVEVPVLLSGAPGRDVTITLIAAVRDGLSDSDYMVSSLSPTFGASETRKVVTVTATDDSDVDPGEYLVLSVSITTLPTGIGEGRGSQRRIYFADNDFQYQASHAGGTTLSVNEQAGTLTATVRVEAPNVSRDDLDALNENVVLSVSTADGTATAGQDYTLLSQTLTFAPADFATTRSGCPQPNPNFCARADKTVTLAITDDTAYEGATAETFTLTLSHETDQRVTYPSPAGETATVSIADDERPALTFTVSPTTILENGGTATVTLATTDGAGITAETAIALSLAGTATKGTDYTISSESLTLTAGQSSVTATITATMDTASDDNETVVVTASSGGTAIGTAQTVTITETLANSAPVLDNAIPDQSAVAGTAFSYQVPADAFSDPDDDTLAYAANKADDTMLPTWLSFDAATRTFTGTPASTDTGTVSVKVTATDTSSATVSDEFDIVVIPAAPAGFTAEAGDGRVRLSWTEPRPRVVHEYRYAAGASVPANAAWTSIGFSDQSTVLISGLTNGTAHAFEVRVVGSGGVGPGAAAAVSATPSVAACSAPNLGGRRSVWSATLTVGRTTFSSGAINAGYNNRQGATPYGSLSPSADFSIGGTSYTIALLETVVRLGNRRQMFLELAGSGTFPDAVRTALQFHWCSDSSGLEAPVPDFRITDDNRADWSLHTTREVALSLPANNDATGTPTVTGTAQAGETLTAGMGNITDADGLPATFPGDYAFQWVRVDADGTSNATDITNATANAYTLTAADVGKRVRVRVSFFDVLGGDEEIPGALSDVVVSAAAPNNAPTSSPGKADVTEDMVYTFAASDFSFSDTDTGDTLSSVKVETLPALGSLTLSGAAVSAMDTVTKAQLDNGELKYTPAANGYGDDYAMFFFRVNDGTADSAIRYPMDIDVMNVNDAPTGALAIVGEPTVGVTLSLDFSGVMDADGLPDKFEINWFHTDNNNRSLGIGSTYELIASDVGKNITVSVEYEDMGFEKERIEISSWPATGTIVDNTNADPTVANEIPDQEAVAGMSFSYQFPANTFNDADTSDTLGYEATKADGFALPTWLSFDAATRTFSGTPASTDTGTVSVKVLATDSSNGAISDQFDILVVPALTVSFEDDNSSNLAEGDSLDVPVLLSGAPGREVTITLSTSHVSGTTDSDYTTSPLGLKFGASETRKVVTVTATDDSEVDPGERFLLALPAAADLPTGILLSSGNFKIFNIADNDFQYQASHAGGTTLSVNEQAGTLTATVRVEAPNVSRDDLNALNENVVLSVSTADGTATAGQDYTLLSQTLTFAPADFATTRSGCPPPSPNFCARADKTVTVAITDDTAYEGATAETFTLTLSHETDQRVTYPSPAGETATVSIADDERPALTFTVSPTTILENGGTATVTLATTDGAGITAETAIALSLAGTATKGTDYTISSESLTLTAGQSSVTATITATMDTASDDNETVVVTASSGGTAIGTAQTVTITETPPMLSIAVDPASIAEAAGTSTVTVSTGTPFTADQTISLTLGGTATVTSDYTLSDTSLTLTAGETSVTATVTAVQDTIDEPDETVIVSASNGGTAIGSATVTITDDDANAAPTVANAIPDQTATAATGFFYRFPANTFNDTDTGDTLSYMATKADGMALPAWLDFSAGTRTFAGTPAVSDVGTVSMKVTASDGNGGSVSDTFDITVEAGPLAHCDTTDTNEIWCAIMVVGVSGSEYGFTVGSLYGYGSLFPDRFNYNGVTHVPVFLSYDGSDFLFVTDQYNDSFASGFKLVLDSDEVSLDGAWDEGKGEYAVADHGLSWSVGDTIQVKLVFVPAVNNAPVVANAIPDQSATAGTAFSYAFPDTTFSDADSDTLSYAAALADGMALPTWLAFTDSTRTFSGTAAAADVGTVAVKVTASDGNGGSVSDTFDITVATTVPGAPASLSATASGSTQINLSWSAPADNGGSAVTGYRIEVSPDGTTNWTELVADTAATAYAHTGLAAGTTRHYRVSAINTNGTGLPSRTADATTGTTVPGAPASLTATASGSTTIDLSWSAPASDGGSAVTGYRIEVSPDGTTNWTELVADTAATAYAHTGLAAGTTRHYRVSAINSVGTGLPSKVDSATTNPTTVANAITLVSNTGQSNADGGHLGLYDQAQPFTTGGHTAGYTLTGVDIAFGLYPGSASYTVSIWTAVSGEPGVSVGTLTSPATITANALNAYTASGINLDPNTTYIVWVDSNSGERNVLQNTSQTAEDSGAQSGWSIGDNSLYRAKDQTAGAWSSYENMKKIAVKGYANGSTNNAPMVANAIPDQSATAGTAFSYVFPDTTFNDTDTGDTLSYAATKADDTTLPTWLAFTDSTRTFSGTAAAADVGTVAVKVTASDGNGGSVSDTFDITVATTVPGAPASLSATASGSTQINLSWSAPADNGGSAVTGYRIEVSPDGTTNWTELVADTASTAYAHTGLAAGTTRHYRVSAINANGTGLPSSTADATTATTVPGAPDSLTATASGSTTIDLSWSAPDTTGGSAVTGYRIEVSPDGTTNWTELVADTASTAYAHTGLAAGTTRHYRVSAINSVGTGLPSSTANATTGAPPNNPPMVANAIPDQSAMAGTEFSYQVPADAFSDADSDSLSYAATKADDTTLPTWLAFTDSTRTFAGTPATADVGTIAVKVTASDGNGGSVSDTFDIVVTHCDTTDTNEIFCATMVVGIDGLEHGFRGSSYGSLSPEDFRYNTDYHDVLYLFYSGTGFFFVTDEYDDIFASGFKLVLDTDEFSLDGTWDEGKGEYTFEDHGLSWSANDAVQVKLLSVPPANSAPTVANAIPDQTATAGTAFSYRFPANTFNDTDTGDTLSYAATKADGSTLPTWLAFTDSTRTFAGTPQVADTGTVSVKVTASDGNGGSVSDTFDITVATTVPGAPDSLTATASGSTTIDLSWSAPDTTGGSAVTGYRIEVSPDGTTNWTELVADTAATAYAHTGLAAGTTRHYRVSAINANGTGLPSSTADATTGTTVPGAPDSLTATASGSTTIDLSWSAPDTTGGSAVTGYRIEVSPDGTTNWTELVADTAATAYAHTGLAAGTTRHYRVSAINTNGTGLPSSTADATTGTTVPGAPDSLTATASGSTTIDLSWSAPDTTGGSAVTGYRIEVSPDGTTNWTELVADTAATAYAHTGLAAGTTRHYRVSAINTNGTGLPSRTADATTGTTVPGAPDSLTATASGSTTIDLSWSAPDTTGGSAVTGYRIEVSPDGTTNWTELVADTAATAYAHTGLAAGTTRHYRVSAINANGTGLPSRTADATTGTTVPGAPDSLTATASGSTTIDLSWSAPDTTGGSAVTGYRIEVSPDGTTNWTELVADTADTTYAHTGLAAGTTRHYRVSAINTNGTGLPSRTADATTATTVPGAPDSLTATASGSTTIDLSWSAPDTTGGSAVTGYRIEVSPDGTTNWTELVADTAATTYAHTGLAAGTTRHYRVSAINTNGTGLPSRTADATTGTTVPGAPDSLTATASGSTTIDLSWSAPASDGGSAITNYKIEDSSDGGSTWFDLAVAIPSTDTTYAHTGLAAGTTRHYRVSAINSVGTGLSSDVANATTDAATPNAAPTMANAIPDQTATAGKAFSYAFPDTTFNDTDTGDTLSYEATKADDTALPTWLAFTDSTRTFAGTPAVADTGTVSVKVTASDGNGGSVGDEFDIVVRAATTTPTAAASLVSNLGQTQHSGSLPLNSWDVVQGFETGASGYTLVSVDLRLNRQSGGISIAVPSVKLMEGTKTATSVTLTGQPVTLTAEVAQVTSTTGENYTFTAPSGTTLSASTRYFLVVERVGTRVQWMTTASTGEDAPPASAAGWSIDDERWRRSASNTGNFTGKVARSQLLRVNGNTNTSTNAAPTVPNAIPDQTATAGKAFSYAFPDSTFNDTDTGDTLSYAATKADDTALPTWLAFTDSTRTFAGTPALADTGTVSVKVTASDGNGGSVGDEFDITVRDLGICARTVAVRDALLARIAGVTDCALVTDTHLAAITGTLDLSYESITVLAAGDFDGLTALTYLDLEHNSLTALPAGVFDELTALTTLLLEDISLTALPAGVFDKLTALTTLNLNDNSLAELPDGVFDELTALTELTLNDNSLADLPDDVFELLTSLSILGLTGNPGAPFSPTAVALPDDGTVPAAGGTVMLDGSGSGGAWGTNVAYSWALTRPTGVTVTFDDAAIAEPTVTIPPVTGGTDLVFTLTVTGRGSGAGSGGFSTSTDTAAVTVNATEPGAPTSLTATASGSTTINLSWTAPADNGGSAVTGYKIEVSLNGTSNWTELVANTNSTIYTHSGLAAGDTRHYRVSAINTNGTGLPSNVDSATTPDGPVIDTLPPVLTQATVNGTTLVLAYDETLDGASVPAAGAFAVTAAGSTVTVNGVSVGGSAVTLTLASAVRANQTVALDYTPGTNPIRDGAGNDAAALSGQSVTNYTPGVGPMPRVSIGPWLLSVSEDVGDAVLTVSLDRPAASALSVAWHTQDHTAESPDDFTASEDPVTFAAGETRKTISVRIVDDAVREDPVHDVHELFFVMLSPGEGYTLADNPLADSSTALVEIVDNDGVGSMDEADDALALVDGVTPEVAAAVLIGEQTLGEAQLDALDRLGNGNGRYDIGDLLSWIARCRRGEARCGSSSTDSGPASAAMLAAAAAGSRSTPRRPRRRDSGRRGRCRRRASTGGIRRRARMAGQVLAILLAATMTWSCTEGGLVGPVAAPPDPGFLTVEWSGPAANRDVGVLLELDGPTIGAVRAPGLELYESSAPGPHRIVVAGVLRPGPLVQFRVPDRNRFALYSVRVVEVTGEDYGLRDAGEYQAVIKPTPQQPGRAQASPGPAS